MNRLLAAPTLFVFICLMTSSVHADIYPLYVGVNEETPADQNWVYAGTGEATQSASDGVTTLSTMAGYATQVGYSLWPLAPVIDRSSGYTITIDLQLELEEHTSNHRAGFSIIVLSNGDSEGIELAFWTDRIWAQNSAFTQGEMVMHDTSVGITRYALTVLADRYYLLVDGRQILTGPLRYYADTVAYPYALENFLFMGDDTTSARAQVRIAAVELRTGDDLILGGAQHEPRSSWKYKLLKDN